MTNSQNIDKVILATAKLWFALLSMVLIAKAFGFAGGTWAAIAILMGAMILGAAIMYKAAVTGKRYAQGAKSRRASVLPYIFSNENKLD